MTAFILWGQAGLFLDDPIEVTVIEDVYYIRLPRHC